MDETTSQTPMTIRKQTNQMNSPTKPPPKKAAQNETISHTPLPMVSTPVDPTNVALFARSAR
jgi:hypothetical protein